MVQLRVQGPCPLTQPSAALSETRIPDCACRSGYHPPEMRIATPVTSVTGKQGSRRTRTVPENDAALPRASRWQARIASHASRASRWLAMTGFCLVFSALASRGGGRGETSVRSTTERQRYAGAPPTPHCSSGDPGSSLGLPAFAWSPEDTSSGRLSLKSKKRFFPREERNVS